MDLSQESEKKSRNEVRDIVRPNDGIHTTHFVPFDPLDKKEGSICMYVNEITVWGPLYDGCHCVGGMQFPEPQKISLILLQSLL